MTLEIGMKAPAFSLMSDSNTKLSLSQMKGKKFILYFYPKDDTPGCTKEACSFRDEWTRLKKLKMDVIGISKDGVAAHQKFKKKYDLPFTLLADEDGKTCEKYGVIIDKNMYGKKYKGIERTTFIINDKGVIEALWRNVKVDGHIEEILEGDY
jgi:peroxiredoxin Q/BCP